VFRPGVAAARAASGAAWTARSVAKHPGHQRVLVERVQLSIAHAPQVKLRIGLVGVGWHHKYVLVALFVTW